MDPVITARHCDVTPELRRRAAAIVQRISAFAGRPMETSVVFGVETGRRRRSASSWNGRRGGRGADATPPR